LAGDRVLLANAGLIRKPDLYRLAADSLCDLCHASGEGFLKAGMASGPSQRVAFPCSFLHLGPLTSRVLIERLSAPRRSRRRIFLSAESDGALLQTACDLHANDALDCFKVADGLEHLIRLQSVCITSAIFKILHL
jgi:hypothetical protein